MMFQIAEISLIVFFMASFWIYRTKILRTVERGENKIVVFAKEKAKNQAFQLLYQSGKNIQSPEDWFASRYLHMKIGLILAVVAYILLDQWFWMLMPLLYCAHQYLGIVSGIRRRKDRIVRRIPFLMDMLILNMESGLDLASALEELVKMDTDHPLHQEIKITLQNIHLGEMRSVAFENLSKRTQVNELEGLAMAITQSESMGSSLTELLRIQSHEIRHRIFKIAEGKAQKAPVKILIPMVLFIFPVIFILLFAPIALQMIALFFS